MSRFRPLDERVVHQGAFITVAVGRFETPDGAVIERDLVRHPGAVSVVPIVGNEVVLVRQFRAAVGDYLLEIPAGKRDVADEPPEVTARRELIEEIGLDPLHLEPLAEFYNSAGFCDEYSYVFMATEFRDAPAVAHGEEEQHMTVERVALADAMALVADGTIRDAKTIIGLSLALARRGL